MEKARLLEMIKQYSDKEAIGMILSNFTDYGHPEKGGMVSIAQFNKVAECLIEWCEGKKPASESKSEALALNSVSTRTFSSDSIEVEDMAVQIDQFIEQHALARPGTYSRKLREFLANKLNEYGG